MRPFLLGQYVSFFFMDPALQLLLGFLTVFEISLTAALVMKAFNQIMYFVAPKELS